AGDHRVEREARPADGGRPGVRATASGRQGRLHERAPGDAAGGTRRPAPAGTDGQTNGGELMTVLENSIRIDATPEKVWLVLASLDALEKYDPGVSRSEIISAAKEGPGAERRCDLAPGGWFKERVAEWRPNEALSFELFECTLPVRRLRHRYTLVRDGN